MDHTHEVGGSSPSSPTPSGRRDDAALLFGLVRLRRLPLQEALGRRAAFGRAAIDGALRREAETAIDRHLDAGIVPIAATDPAFPPLLRGILNPPAVLFVKGDLEALRADSVAVVGTREPTPAGTRRARQVARRLAGAGFAVVAGLAKGIDTAAHEATIEAGGRTVAVCATPLDRTCPAGNAGLARRIEEGGGALVSEYAIGDPTFPSCFKHRDRIQAGMSIAVVPVQTPGDDGTMHTVRYAERYGRLLLCPVPPPSEARIRASRGVRELLRAGRAEPLRWRGLVDRLRRLRDELLESIDAEPT